MSGHSAEGVLRPAAVVAYVGLGGNLGDPRRSMAHALQHLDRHPQIAVEAVSPIYRTPPWGRLNQPDFMNAVARIRTELGARELLDTFLETEKALHRHRGERWGPRNIDLDLLAFGDLKIEEPGLLVPHPRLRERAFVLVPLLSLAPDMAIDDIPLEGALAKLDTASIVEIERDGEWWRKQ